jgi:mannonate dehydratase
MRIGMGQFMALEEKRLQYLSQIGIDDIILNFYHLSFDYPQFPGDEPPLSPDSAWTYDELVDLRNEIEEAGFNLAGIENVPIGFYEDVILGREGREESIERMKTTIQNMGEAGIPIFGYHWAPAGVWRTSTEPVRGGAEATSFELESVDTSLTHEREYTEEELWENYEYFLKELLPVAEDAGIKMGLHPNDPPVKELGGISQLFRDFESFKKAMNIVPSDNHGLVFCLGCWSEMGENLEEVIRYFGERNKLFYIHFRDVEGTVPSFNETFVDEGNYCSYEIMRLLKEVGFNGVIIPDHVPKLVDDTDWGHRGRAHAVGYLNGLLNAINRSEK